LRRFGELLNPPAEFVGVFDHATIDVCGATVADIVSTLGVA